MKKIKKGSALIGAVAMLHLAIFSLLAYQQHQKQLIYGYVVTKNKEEATTLALLLRMQYQQNGRLQLRHKMGEAKIVDAKLLVKLKNGYQYQEEQNEKVIE